ncbi:MAG TPA: beta-Ala-His dipeptidase [Solirubrobacteraceae bacterium]|jgi:dipeptidase D|nr:beta-Ala-His dipeptidase [Solirubrobacteraceae bacterium]
MPDDAYAGLEPPELWRHFAALNRIPRAPGNEAGAREYVRSVAERAGSEFVADARGNALVRVAARPGRERAVTVAVQAHLDMVCESAPGVDFDFDRDPIVTQRDGDTISARETTLGADNGIGVAAALALLSTPDLPCGPLELLFTIEEETGLHGALALDASLLRARSMINLDSEDDEALTVGCAGGADVALSFELEREPLAPGWSCAELSVSGLTGGHSGVQIHEHRANAIKLLVTAIDRLRAGGVELRLISLDGGSAHNAIPLDASAHLAIVDGAIARAHELTAALVAELDREWRADEPGISIELSDVQRPPHEAASAPASATLVSLLRELPHGVIAISDEFPGVVATSINLALASTDAARVDVLTSIRSVSAERLDAVASRVKALAAASGASAELTGGYPGWEPRRDSPIAAAAAAAYQRVYARRPKIEIVHGGLECGALVAKLPDLDVVSFGPLIREAHTPREHVYASTVASTWNVLVSLLDALSN